MENLMPRNYLETIRRRWAFLVTIPILSAVLSGLISVYVLVPKYEVNATLLVNQRLSGQQTYYDTIMANQALVNTYSDIIQSKAVESDVISQLNLPYSLNQLNQMIVVSSPNQSLVIDIGVIDKSQDEAASIANALATTFQTKAQSYMDIQNVQIIDPASVIPNAHPVQPHKTLNIMVAFLLGLLSAIGLVFGLEYLDPRIRTEKAVQRYLNIPVLGTIPDFMNELQSAKELQSASIVTVSRVSGS